MPNKKNKKPKPAPVVQVSERPAAVVPRRRWLVYGVVAVLLVVGAVAALMNLRHTSPRVSVASAANEYVDSKSCVECHRDVAETFSHTGMSRTFSKPNPSSMVEDFKVANTVYHKSSGNYYSMIQRGGEYYQRRHQIGFDGKETNVVEERIDYVIGSGEQARSYLHRSVVGKLNELPVTWYAEKKGYWGMTPGYDSADQKDFHGTISKDCVFCHNAYPPALPKAIEESGEPIFASELPSGIDCQRCHGPGLEHEKAARAANPDEKQLAATIVNPAHLSRERQLEVCMECHLSTSGSQDTNISLRFDRKIFSYMPGEPLSEYKLYFDSAKKQDPGGFGIADAAYRLKLSRCFLQSQMTCLTCHDPHEESHGKEAQSNYLQACANCHRGVAHTVSLPKTETCVTCHMPKRRGEYAVHTVLTDHYIQRQRPLRDLLNVATLPAAAPEAAGKLAAYYPEKLRDDGSDQLYLAIAESESGVDAKAGAAALETAIRRYKPTEAEYYAALGRAYARCGRHDRAVIWFEEAAKRKPADHLIGEEFVESLISLGQLSRAQQILERLVDNPPPDARLLTNLGNVYARQDQLAKAEVMLQRAIATDPESAEAYNLMGLVKQREGNEGEADRLFREAIRYRPDLAEAHNNIASLLVATGRYSEADFEFKQAVATAPKFAEAHHSYGLFLVAAKYDSQAETQLREAVRLDPGDAMFHADLGDLLAETRHEEEAADEYKAALKFNSNLDAANVGLGTILVRKGEHDVGKVYCSAALRSSDPSIVERARSCEVQ
jgi:Tfp pilus assembly protein PilF